MTQPALRVEWRARAEPLAPLAAAASGAAARALARRLLALDDEALARLRGVGGPGLLVVTSELADALPWVDGVMYLGRDPAAPSLLLPTALAPSVPAPLVERAVLARARGLATPVAVVPPCALASVAGARPVARAALTAWLAQRAGEAVAP